MLSTCRGALEEGFEVVLLRGAHSTYDIGEEGRTAVQVERDVEGLLEREGARVVGWEEWVQEVEGSV